MMSVMLVVTLIFLVLGVLPWLGFFFNILRTMWHAIKTGMKSGQETRDDFHWDK